MSAVLSLKEVSVQFGAYRALHGVNLQMHLNERCLLYTSDAADD